MLFFLSLEQTDYKKWAKGLKKAGLRYRPKIPTETDKS